MKIKSAIDRATDPRVNRQAMKKKTLSLAAGFAALFFASSSLAFTSPIIHLRRKILCELAAQGL